MKFIHVVFLNMVFVFLGAFELSGYSYAAAGKEPTIDAKEKIMQAVNRGDFSDAKRVFLEYEKNYRYLNDDFIQGLYEGLKESITNNDKDKTLKYLELSIAAEVQRRIDGGFKNIDNYNVAKVMLAKANKFYKLLSVSLNKETNEKLKHSLMSCTKAIGNPGLFGVGSKQADKDEYAKHQKIIVDIIRSLISL